MAQQVHDALVIGAGPNGLVAANLLAQRGWDVLVLEQQDRPGGAVATAEDVAPGFRHDTFSSFYPLGGASPVLRGLRLEQHGLSWAHAPAVLGTPTADGSWALLHHDPVATAAGLDAASAGDGEAWLRLVEQWNVVGHDVVDALLAPFPPIRSGLRLARRLRRVGGLQFVRMLLEPSLTFTQSRFRAEGARLLISGNAAHADLHPAGAGSGLFGWLLAMLGQDIGFPVPVGGAGRLADALVDRLRGLGAHIACSTPVVAIEVDGGRAVGVRTADGRLLRARRAVLADVPAPTLYRQLLPASAIPDRVDRAIERFEWDPGTIKVDWALSGPVPWHGPPDRAPGTVHLARDNAHLSSWMSQIDAGIVPDEPFLLLGQMTTTDPTRSPTGTEALWAYTRVPRDVRGDAATDGPAAIRGDWDGDDAQRMADRMQATIERYAPGFSERIIARRILAPTDLQRRNANLVGGAIGGGTSGIHQQLIFRPIPGAGRAETPVAGLYLASASAHPGGGVHGACGANAARAALAHSRLRSTG
jgi:phytoene dehydrogenase-like protein